MPGETPSQPGWYPDQNGALRWFDGNAWTDHVQPGSGPASVGDEPTILQPGTPPSTQPLTQRPAWQGGPPSSPPPSGPPSGPPTGPPSGPPGGPGSPYGAVPQPSFPGGPGGPGGPGFPPPSSGGGNKGLLIVLAVVGAVVLIAILAAGSWAIFLRDDDGGGGDDGNGNGNGGDGGSGISLPDTPPEEVAEQFMTAAQTSDCETLEELVTERLLEELEEEGGCEVEEMPADFSYTVDEATIDEEAETASVPVALTFPELIDPATITLEMVVVDDEWRIDDIPEPEVTDSTSPSVSVPTLPTDIPTDFTDFPTDLPTDFPTDFPTDPSELESYLSEYFSEYLTFTG